MVVDVVWCVCSQLIFVLSAGGSKRDPWYPNGKERSSSALLHRHRQGFGYPSMLTFGPQERVSNK